MSNTSQIDDALHRSPRYVRGLITQRKLTGVQLVEGGR